MAGVDLGKQVGPLPLGAWVVVVGGGLGIALYTRRQSAVPTEIGVDTSGDAGVGTGAVGGFVPTSPNPVAPVATPTTNEQWGVMVTNGLIAKNYPPTTVDSMVRKYLAGITSTMSPAEFALLSVALAQFGSPPQVLPPDDSPPASTPPPTTTPVPAKPKYTMQWSPVGVTGSYVGITLAALQNIYTQQAAGLGVITPTPAVRASYIAQAATRNGMLPTTRLRAGQLISVRKAVAS